MSYYDYNVEDLEDFTPFENFLSGIRDNVTQMKYRGQLEMFLNPRYRWDLSQQKRMLLPDDELAVLVNDFVELIKKNPAKGKEKIKRYVQYVRKQIREGSLNPNTARSRLKPIKSLLRSNEIEFSWYLIDRNLPKETKSEDRAYTREEIQNMLVHCHDIIDKVIIVGFSSGGFRLEAWDYFTWDDVKFFRNDDGTYKGGALRVYRGDSEEYWTYVTPEFCNLLDLYREYWRNKFMKEPSTSDPLLVRERSPFPVRLQHVGISRRVKKIVDCIGLRDNMMPGKKRYEVQLDHGFRKYFNTMLRRARVNFADKEDMMGHKTGLESSYERYVEEDIERFSEYQKAFHF
ncbi:MAG: hypothetical protein OXC46_01760 [Thaumarchaeota archaeon]|nr:hypothetical protein [Nitrososphaerota archaeon]